MYKPLHDKAKIISESDQQIPQLCTADYPQHREDKQLKNNNHELSETH